jgi:hypothetical protein
MPTAPYETFLTRGIQKDLVLLKHPTIPDRTRVHSAYRLARGYLPDAPEQTTPDLERVNVDDCLAVAFAALALGWTGASLPGLGSFRSYNRDVVAYGEAAVTALYELGYQDTEELLSAGLGFYSAFMDAFFEASKSAAGFTRAP